MARNPLSAPSSKGSSLSAAQAGGNGTGLTASAALASANGGAAQASTSATVTLADGTSTTMNVSVTAEGVLVIRLPEQADVKGNEKAVTLLAMAAAKEMGVTPDALKGVLIQSAG